VKNYALEAPDLDYGVALVPKPALDHGEHVSFAGARCWSSSRDRSSAMHRSSWPAFPPGLSAGEDDIARGRQRIPGREGRLARPTFMDDPRVRVFMEQSLTSRTPPAHPGWVEMEEVIDRAVEESMYGRRAPRWCLDDAAKEIATIAARFETQIAPWAAPPSFPGRLAADPWAASTARSSCFRSCSRLSSAFLHLQPAQCGEHHFCGRGERHPTVLRSQTFHQSLRNTLFFVAGTVPGDDHARARCARGCCADRCR
jgi:hypothetical protein